MSASYSFARALSLTVVLVLPSTAPVAAQTPARYEATPHGRVLACFGEAYALVELIDVATQNLALLALEIQRPDARPPVAAGLSMAGTQIEQRQALDVAERLVDCTESAARRATADAAAAYAAVAVSEEVDVAIRMAEGFAGDYERVAAQLGQFFDRTADATARTTPTRPFVRFGDELRTALLGSKSSIATIIERSTPRP